MKDNNGNKKIYFYQSGNTIKYGVVPEEIPEMQPGKAPQRQPEKQPKQPRQPKKKTSHRTRKNREKALTLNLKSVLFLSVSVVITFGICVKYLSLMSQLNERKNNLTELQSQLDDLRTENNTTYSRLNSKIDLEEIYQVATEQLGMVYAVDGQIVDYTAPPSEYVEQYANIPDVNDENLLEEILELMK